MVKGVFANLDLSVLLALVAVLVAGILRLCRSSAWNLPPGPRGLPFVGFLPFLGKKPYIKLLELKKKYGPIYSLRIGSHPVVVLADYASMREAFAKDALIGRPPDDTFRFNKETRDSGAFTGLPWKELRRFSLHVLRDLGLGKTRLEVHIAEEIQELLERMEKELGKPIVPKTFLAPSVSNNIASLVFGKRRQFDDPKRILLDDALNRSAKLAEAVVRLEFFPLLKRASKFLGLGNRAELETVMTRFKQYTNEEIEEHVKTLDPRNPRDYVDKFILEMDKMKSNPNSAFICPVLQDLSSVFFGAGSQTVRSAMEWLMLISAAFPDVQSRVQAEIDEVIGSERFPARSDYLKMPYTEATIMETLRWRASLPLNFLRYTLEDTQLGPYFIPKHTRVLAVNWAVHHDPDLWGEDVDQFKAERFLSPDGKEIVKPEYDIPFSIGKRSCPGESLAYVEVFMYFTAILRKFRLRLPEGVKPDFEGSVSVGLETKPYHVYLELR